MGKGGQSSGGDLGQVVVVQPQLLEAVQILEAVGGNLANLVGIQMPVEILSGCGRGAVSYTHLTLPTRRPV